MRRSSSGARVAEGGGGIVSEAALPTYDPLSAAGRREAARTRALARAVHCIPVVLLVCGFLLWLSASHTHLGGKHRADQHRCITDLKKSEHGRMGRRASSD